MRCFRFSLLVRAAFTVVLFALPLWETYAIPAFARKTGLRCTGCHVSWPVLNDFGRAYRDNGYQLRTGRDDPTTTPQGYWPVAIRVTPHYEYDTLTNQETDQGKKSFGTGGTSDIAMDLLTAGTLSEKASFQVVAAGFSADESPTLESYWAYFPKLLFRSDWFNLRLGKHEVDLPVSGHRSINLTNGYLVYSHHPPATDINIAGDFALDENQRGIEIVGHDRGSLTRYSLSIFNANDSEGSRTAFESASLYAHFQKFWQLRSSVVSELEVGLFDAQASYPTTSLTLVGEPIPGEGGNLKVSSRYGAEAQVFFGSLAAPLELVVVYAHGKDVRDLYVSSPGPDQDGLWRGGFAEAIWVVPSDMLHCSLFARYDAIRNTQQPYMSAPDDLGDQDQITAGIKYTINYSNRAEYALHAEHSINRTRKEAFDGSDVRAGTTFIGIDFAY